jgi:DNA-directed RNA polymerase specialized sigma24 family protein
MSNISDEKLIKAAIDGDTEAVDTLKDRIKSVTLPTIKKRGIQGSDEDVKVLANQIEEKVLNVLHQFRFQVSLQTWVHRITVNMIIGYQRRIMGWQPVSQSMNGK